MPTRTPARRPVRPPARRSSRTPYVRRRLLALGTRTGNADAVMSRIAERSEHEAIAALDDRLRRIEPTLVIVLSVIVGLILFSVMLPLMGIMSSLG